ncbi:putative transcriptional regulator [Gordonia araii NBRC 100433]|uniref:Putative transcriptional regulator n=1 Tax=Gordonia araii NBRC 100433 TaxID=1073574 RepID=G7H6T0_9ACTN|nr:TetR/AcrR family transcriptional regulator [Gordonia araii]NNG95973.1 TetR family transcriptional regulator [Gordonia araii NBRC 100433]GAB11555.1 putative transcriptional regulator [Gordonia araii NBRC 100433]
MPRASAADAALTAQRVLDSATDLFASRGFADVSLDDVAQAAAVTRGAVYHHYRNKAGLFSAVADRLQARVADAVVAAATEAGERPGAQLRAGSHAFLDAITDGPAVRILLIDAPAVIGWQEWRRLDAENSAPHLRDALREVGVAQDLLDATTAQLSAAMNEAALWIAQHEDTAAARRQAHAALDTLLATYLDGRE